MGSREHYLEFFNVSGPRGSYRPEDRNGKLQISLGNWSERPCWRIRGKGAAAGRRTHVRQLRN